VYTEEARRLHVQGDVAVQVVFSATGEIRIVGVVKGLGHGLDEAAVAATRQIRFTPARRDGQFVDYPATIHVVFALS
jgi:TonB family protein